MGGGVFLKSGTAKYYINCFGWVGVSFQFLIGSSSGGADG